jgi:Zn-dependent peptidase ImmA (M78 family)
VTRQAFTLAHELGHWLLHNEKLRESPELSILFSKPLGELNKEPIEKEANCFAASLLVPKSFLEEYKDEDPLTIAQIFGVSQDVIGFRIKDEYR